MSRVSKRPRVSAVPLGWNASPSAGFGFGRQTVSESDGAIVTDDTDGHILTIGPTGKGKGRSAVIPTLLMNEGSVVVFDPKGEPVHCTARRRREMGQTVWVLDPFHVVSNESDRLDPLDLLDLPGGMIDCDSEMLAAQLANGHHFHSDPYWTDTSCSLISGLIGLTVWLNEPGKRNLNAVRRYFYMEDMEYHLAKTLDANKNLSPLAYEQIANYLQIPSDKTRPCVRSTAETFVSVLGSEAVAGALRDSTVSLREIREGRKDFTLYITIPPDKLESHGALLRLWMSTVLTTVGRRQQIPPIPTLFLIDEAAQMGRSPTALKTAITLLRGSGLRVWTFWQDLSQIQANFDKDWPTIVNNSPVLQLLGMQHPFLARQWGEILNCDPRDIMELASDESLVYQPEHGLRRLRKCDYLRDPIFKRQFDPNPRYAGTAGAPESPRSSNPPEHRM